MRIALLTYSTKPRGGVVHTLALAEALAAHGHEVTVWTLGRGGDGAFFRAVDPSVAVRVVPFEGRDGEAVGARIVRSIAEFGAALGAAVRAALGSALADELGSALGSPLPATGVDVVHAQDCISANAAALALAELPPGDRPPLVRTIHHLDTFSTPELVACHERAILVPDARLCVSAAVATEVEAGWGLRATVIPNGVDSERFAAAAAPEATPERERWTAELGRYVLALGGIEPRKGSIELLEAFALLRAEAPESGLSLIFGGGETLFDYRDYRARFEARAAELGIEPLVLGTITEERLAPLVAAASALGFVSTKEGFGLAAMEALAAGVPVVARRLPVIEEVFGASVGYGEDPESFAAALQRALERDRGPIPGGDRDPAPPPELGRALAAAHRWSDVAAAHGRFYRAVLASGGDDGAPVALADPQLAR